MLFHALLMSLKLEQFEFDGRVINLFAPRTSRLSNVQFEY